MKRTLKTAVEYWDYILERNMKSFNDVSIARIYIIRNHDDYIQFLKQPLQLWMFIPCDKDGNILEKPEFIDIESVDYQNYTSEVKEKYQEEYYLAEKEYQQAQDRKIFTGFELFEDTMFNHTDCVIRKSDGLIISMSGKTIENIASGKVDLVERVAEQFKY